MPCAARPCEWPGGASAGRWSGAGKKTVTVTGIGESAGRRGKAGQYSDRVRRRPAAVRTMPLLLSVLSVLLLSAGCGSAGGKASSAVTSYDAQIFAMDTYMTITAYGTDAQEAVQEAVSEINRLDALLSTENEDSEIYALNAAGGGSLSEDTAYLINRALEIAELTDGAFDIAVYPLMVLWGFPDQDYHVPTQEEIDALLPLTDIANVVYTADGAAELGEEASSGSGTASGESESGSSGGSSVSGDGGSGSSSSSGTVSGDSVSSGSDDGGGDTSGDSGTASGSEGGTDASGDSVSYGTLVLENGAQIDLGGITKGYLSDRMREIFSAYDITGAVCSLGGNIYTYGYKTDGSQWNIGIQDPDGTTSVDVIGSLQVTDVSVITSGGYERYFEEDGVTYHHILDPVTGYPADSGLSSVTIVSADGTLADGLSTALFVMGADEAIGLWRENSDLFEFILIDEAGNITISEGLDGNFEPTDSGIQVTVISE